MQPTAPDPKQDMSPIKKYAPLALVVVAVIAVLGWNLASGSDDNDGSKPSDVKISKGPDSLADAQLMPNTMTFAKAKRDGKEGTIDWGKRCDTSTGKLALPLLPPPDCFAPFTGDNGGATANGVTKDSIKVVLYLAQANDPVLKFIYDQIGNNDTTDQQFETSKGFVTMFNQYYETYGRKVELVRYDATGNSSDPVAAVADAESIAKDVQPFAVIGGPILTNAFADTLAKNKVLCIACTPGQPNSWYVDRAPYVWDVQKAAEQNQQLAAEYIGKRLAGNVAKNAGDAAMHNTKRVFGYVHVSASDNDPVLEKSFTKRLADDYGVEFAVIQTYASPLDLAGSGRDLITKLKDAGVTSVVFNGDPLAPQSLTRIASEQDWHPEWVITGSALVDTAAFSRTYDQAQWAHAFGPSNLFARIPPTQPGGAGYLYRWYFDATAPADQTVPVVAAPHQVIFSAIQGMGPAVTYENFRKVLFSAPIVKSTTISPQVSYGDRGFFPATDYAGLDDQTEIWWDPEPTGVDELGRDGAGLWRYVDGGKRYLPGEWPTGEPKVFDKAGTVTVMNGPPAEATLPTYEPLPR